MVNVTDNYIRIGAPPTPEALIKREKEAANGPMSIKKQQRERSTSTSGSPTKKSSKKAKKAEKYGKIEYFLQFFAENQKNYPRTLLKSEYFENLRLSKKKSPRKSIFFLWKYRNFLIFHEIF